MKILEIDVAAGGGGAILAAPGTKGKATESLKLMANMTDILVIYLVKATE